MSDKPRTHPIEEQPYLSGPTVVSIDDLRVSRGLTRRPFSRCNHLRLSYDPRERRIWCRDCETDVEPFDAFKQIVDRVDRHAKALAKRAEAVAAAEAHVVRSRAAKALDAEWAHQNSVPACPHCGEGLFPEDFTKGISALGVEYAKAKAKRRAERKKP